MARAIRPFVDRALGGQLDRELRERSARGDSSDAIAKWLLTEHDIAITAETIRQWVNALPDPEPEAELAG